MKIKLVVSDIDGVWTDGSMYYDENGNELKRYSTYDAAGVRLLQKYNIHFAIVTGEESLGLKRRASKLKISNLFMSVKNKVKTIDNLCTKYNIEHKNIAFIGDDINDLELLSKVYISAAPINAHELVKNSVKHVIPVKGGDGAFRYFVEKIIFKNLTLEQLYDDII